MHYDWQVVGGLNSLNLNISNFETHPLGKSQNPVPGHCWQPALGTAGHGAQRDTSCWVTTDAADRTDLSPECRGAAQQLLNEKAIT